MVDLLIKIVNLCKSFSDQTILENINLNIAKGEIHGIIGSSGAGKSTLLRCINGLEPYHSGSVMVDDVKVDTLSSQSLRALRKKIGMVFQDFALLENKTAYDNIMLPLQCWAIDRSVRHHRVSELLALVGLPDKANVFPKNLSGGQKQRVAIARTLALNPDIILCDEATSALDPQTAKSILTLLKTINQQTQITIVMVTHQLEVIKSICHRVSIIDNKTVVLTAPVIDVLVQEPLAYQKLIGSHPIMTPYGNVGLKIICNDSDNDRQLLSVLAQQLQINFQIIDAKTEHCNGHALTIFSICFLQHELSRVCYFLDDQQIKYCHINPPITNNEASHVF